jgi:hypothetical protein
MAMGAFAAGTKKPARGRLDGTMRRDRLVGYHDLIQLFI